MLFQWIRKTLPLMEQEALTPEVGQTVEIPKYGVGTILSVGERTIGEDGPAVYHVRFENGDVRHFTVADFN